jgi:hypothetical protein
MQPSVILPFYVVSDPCGTPIKVALSVHLNP